MGHAEIRFLHGSCGNQISAWAMWKSNFFSLVQMNITIFLNMYGNFSMTIAYTNSYRSMGFIRSHIGKMYLQYYRHPVGMKKVFQLVRDASSRSDFLQNPYFMKCFASIEIAHRVTYFHIMTLTAIG